MKVFISHQKKDKEKAKEIADYLRSVKIDVYFDEFDRELQDADRNNDPKAVVNAIRKGVSSCTHMICIVSKNTLTSSWVPFEVGYGYDNIELYVLTLKGILNSELPDYVKVAKIIRDIYDINRFATSFGNKYIFESKNFSEYKSYSHPLSSVMDSIIS